MTTRIHASLCPISEPCSKFGGCTHENYNDCDLFNALRIEMITNKWLNAKRRFKSLKSTAKRGMTTGQNEAHKGRLKATFEQFKEQHSEFFKTSKGRLTEKMIGEEIKNHVVTTVELYRILRDCTRY